MFFKLINKYLNKENKALILRYILISLIGYTFVFVGLYILIDLLNFDSRVAFGIIYGLSYLLLYYLQLKLLFKGVHTIGKLLRFISSIVFFYLLANLLFITCTWFNLNYLIATALTIIVLMPLRFLVAKLVVFKN